MSYKSPSHHEFHSAAQGLSDDVRGLTDRLRAVLTERSRSFIDLSKSLQGMDVKARKQGKFAVASVMGYSHYGNINPEINLSGSVAQMFQIEKSRRKGDVVIGEPYDGHAKRLSLEAGFGVFYSPNVEPKIPISYSAQLKPGAFSDDFLGVALAFTHMPRVNELERVSSTIGRTVGREVASRAIRALSQYSDPALVGIEKINDDTVRRRSLLTRYLLQAGANGSLGGNGLLLAEAEDLMNDGTVAFTTQDLLSLTRDTVVANPEHQY